MSYKSPAQLVFESISCDDSESSHELFEILVKGQHADPRIMALRSLMDEGATDFIRFVRARGAA